MLSLAAATLVLFAGAEVVLAQNASVATGTVAVGAANATASSAVASATAVANTGANPLIPTTLSIGCSSFLEFLNADASIAACSAPLQTALSLFAPTQAATYAVDAAQVNSTLSTLCATAPCSDSLLRSTLSHFSGNCSAELQAGTEVVVDTYDAIYLLGPFLTAICTKDVAGDFCLNDIVAGDVPSASAANATSLALSSAAALATATGLIANAVPAANATVANSTVSVVNSTISTHVLAKTFNIASYIGDAAQPAMLFFDAVTAPARRLLRRATANTTVQTNTTTSSSVPLATSTTSASAALATTGILPNGTTFASSGIPFLLLSTNMSSSILCTPCTKAILAPYVSFESRSPYTLGLANSKMLGKQGALWNGVAATCGTGFVASIAALAGETNAGLGSGASGLERGLGGVGMALLAVVVAMMV